MKSVLLLLSMSMGCQSTVETPQPEQNTQKEQAKAPDVKKASTAQDIIDNIVKEQGLDAQLNVKQDPASKIHMAGTAKDNQSIAVLIEALGNHPQFSKVYLKTTEKVIKENQERRAFEMSANFAS